VKKIFSRFSMKGAKSVSTPMGSHFGLTKNQSLKTDQEKAYMSKVPYALAIESLMYAMGCTRPDIAHAVGVVSKYMSNPRKQHWEVVKWILRYLRGTSDMSLCFTCANLKLQGYALPIEGSRLTKDQSLKTDQEKAYMSKVPYALAIKSLMYAMGCTRADIAHAVGVVSRYMSNPGKQH
jgi:antitoxin component HigA of HigAB toxin-antitoxin module